MGSLGSHCQQLIYNKFMDSKFRLANFSGLDHREWSIESNHSITTVVNKLTGDQFVYQTLSYQSRHFYDAYRSRASYKIPHTPQVILPDRISQKDRPELLVERGSISLQQTLSKSRCEGTFISILKTTMRVIQILVKKYGYFRVTSKMVKSSRSGHLLVWFHQYTSSNFRQFPISPGNPEEDSKIVILDIIKVFQEYGQRKILSMLRDKICKQKSLSFEKVISIMESENTILSCLPESGKKEQQKFKNLHFKSPDFIKKKSANQSVQKYDPKKGVFRKQTKQFQKYHHKLSANNEGKQANPLQKNRLASPSHCQNFIHSSTLVNQSYRTVHHQKNQGNNSLAIQKQSKSQRRQEIENKCHTPPFQRNRWASNEIQVYSKDEKLNQSIKFASPNKFSSEVTNKCFHSHSFINQSDNKMTPKIYQSNTNPAARPQKQQFFNFIPSSPQEKIQKNSPNTLFKNSTVSNLMISSTQNLIEPTKNTGMLSHASEKNIKNSQNTDKLKKPSFRDSGNSLATTNFLNSITSSGRTKLLDQQSSVSLSQSKNGLLSSFGEKDKFITKLDNRFTVKASKIIEQYSEDWVPNSVQSMANTKSERDLGSEFDLERDFDSILWSEKNPTKRSIDMENEMKALESEIKNILDF